MKNPEILNIEKRIKNISEEGRFRKELKVVAFVLTPKNANIRYLWHADSQPVVNNVHPYFQHFSKKTEELEGGLEKYVFGVISEDARNGNGGNLMLTVKNDFGVVKVVFELKIKGFNVPYGDGDPFASLTNSAGHRLIGICLKNVIKDQYKIQWFRDGVEIEEDDDRYLMVKSAPMFGDKISGLLIRMRDTECEGIYKTIVKNASGEFHCDIDTSLNRKAPYLFGEVEIKVKFAPSPKNGLKEEARVEISVPFSSYTKYNLTRWSCSQKLCNRLTKEGNYRQTVRVLKNNCYIAYLAFSVTCDSDGEKRIYRCDIINDIGKITAFAEIKFSGADYSLDYQEMDQETTSGVASREDEEQLFWPISNIIEY